VTVIADPSECSFQFKATGTEKFTTSGDVAKSGLVNLSVNYNNETAPAGTKAKVKIGEQTLSADSPDFAKALPAAIKAHGYPASADPAEINGVMTVVMLWLLVVYVTLVYARSRRGWLNCSPAASATAASRCRTISAMAGSAASCLLPCSRSRPPPATSIPACGIRSVSRS
jgi:hypothetical protein